jgi:uncharacterized surface protein with fasciclin (FAS1) repeats
MKRIRTSLIAAGISLVLGGAVHAQQDSDSPAVSERQQQSRTLVASSALERVAEEHRDLSTFLRALEVTGLADSITGDTQYTVFAPTNEAFEELGRDAEDIMAPENRARLVAMLRAHIVADDVSRESAGEQIQEALTLDGETIALEERDGSLVVGEAKVRDTDVREGNLRIYMIDELLDRGESQVATSDGQRPRG